MGSRGSIIPFFHKQSKNIFTLTDRRMTRFMMTLENAVKLVWKLLMTEGGEMGVVKAPSMKVIDIIHSFQKNQNTINRIRPGEKITNK